MQLSASEQENRVLIVGQALASVRLESLQPSEETLAIYQRHVEGEINLEQAGREVKALHDRKYGPVRLSANAGS